jgi:hypothetical protein
MEHTSPWCNNNIAPHEPTFRESLLFYYNGLSNNRRNKTVNVQFKAMLEEMQENLSSMDDALYRMKAQCRDAEMQEGAEILDRDEWVRKISPRFFRRFLKELCIAYKSLDEVLISSAKTTRTWHLSGSQTVGQTSQACGRTPILASVDGGGSRNGSGLGE